MIDLNIITGRHCMGRSKKIVKMDQLDRRETGYYSTPSFVAEYLQNRMLSYKPEGKLVLDPCCGKGELVEVFQHNGKTIYGIDIYDYSVKNINFFVKADFIKLYGTSLESSRTCLSTINENIHLQDFDYYIANPPYNCHEVEYIVQNKSYLKKLFGDIGTHNMYSMFISALIECAKPGALIGLVTHDSFFTSKIHTSLRRNLLLSCAIHEIIMCPTCLFEAQNADVRTSIIILQKGLEYQGKVKIKNRSLSLENLQTVLEHPDSLPNYELSDILLLNENDNNELVIECPEDIRILFKHPRLGDTFPCITGISTGKDELYLSPYKSEIYPIPFYKNPGLDKFYTDKILYLHRDFLTLSKDIKNFTVRNKQFLYKAGITCSSMGVAFSACYRPEGTAYGINPNIVCANEDIWWLLSYLNSSLVTYLIRGVILRTNMITSGYVARLPIIPLTKEDRAALCELGLRAYELTRIKKSCQLEKQKINGIIYQKANVSSSTIEHVEAFVKNLIKST